MDGPESVWPINTWLGQNEPGPEKEKKPTMLGQADSSPAT